MSASSRAAAFRLQPFRGCNRAAGGYEEQGKASQSTEERLRERLLRGLAGEAVAYHEFLRELSAYLRGFVRRRLARMPDEVEDIVQESLLAVHNQRHTYDPAQPLTPWLHAIARYKLVDHLRRCADAPLGGEVFEDAAEVLQAFDDRAAEARRDVAKLLESLPERHRLPIVHVKLEGRSVAETARLTGMSESAVKIGVHRGLKALAARLGRGR